MYINSYRSENEKSSLARRGKSINTKFMMILGRFAIQYNVEFYAKWRSKEQTDAKRIVAKISREFECVIKFNFRNVERKTPNLPSYNAYIGLRQSTSHMHHLIPERCRIKLIDHIHLITMSKQHSYFLLSCFSQIT